MSFQQRQEGWREIEDSTKSIYGRRFIVIISIPRIDSKLAHMPTWEIED